MDELSILQLTYELYYRSNKTILEEDTMDSYFMLGLSDEEAFESLNKNGENGFVNPNRNCPPFLCCLLPCLNQTKPMLAYQQCITDTAVVIRDGEERCIDVESVALGDILLLKPGTVIGADVKLIDCTENFCTSCFEKRSIIMGGKRARNDEPKTVDNIGFAGCTVLRGQAKGTVVASGDNTLMAYLILNGMWPLGTKASSMQTK